LDAAQTQRYHTGWKTGTYDKEHNSALSLVWLLSNTPWVKVKASSSWNANFEGEIWPFASDHIASNGQEVITANASFFFANIGHSS